MLAVLGSIARSGKSTGAKSGPLCHERFRWRASTSVTLLSSGPSLVVTSRAIPVRRQTGPDGTMDDISFILLGLAAVIGLPAMVISAFVMVLNLKARVRSLEARVDALASGVSARSKAADPEPSAGTIEPARPRRSRAPARVRASRGWRHAGQRSPNPRSSPNSSRISPRRPWPRRRARKASRRSSAHAGRCGSAGSRSGSAASSWCAIRSRRD